jgi:GxxExxY protein
MNEELTGKIIGCAMKVHSALGPGFLESVYQKALFHELGKAGLRVESERPIAVLYDGVVVGDFVADLLVDGQVIVELKSVERLCKAHEVQTVNYLTATGLDIGLLINFGAESLEFKKKFRLRFPNPVNPVNPV